MFRKGIKHYFRRVNPLLVSYILSVIVAVVVYLTGGTTTSYPNLMYIPISIVSTVYGKKHGVIHSVFSALLVGPFMPLNRAAQLSQDPANWMLRVLIYASISLVIGFISDYRRQEFVNSRRKDKELADAQMAMIFSLVKLSESRDDTTGAHVERVADCCRLMAEKLRQTPEYKDCISNEYIDNIYMASSLHDIGKVGIPDSILLKPGKLTAEEFKLMKRHTLIGADTLAEVMEKYPDNRFLNMGISIARYHHEKWDGTGYPEGFVNAG